MVSLTRALLAVGAIWLGWGSVASAQQPTAVLEEHGCLGCHSVDGSARVGPTFAGLVGLSRVVATGEGDVERVVDAAAVRRALTSPESEVPAGFAAGAMPTFALEDAELDALVAAVAEVSAAPPPPEPEGSLAALVVAAAVFVLSHLGLSFGPIRRRLIGALGEARFQGLYSLVALASMVALFYHYSYVGVPYVGLWHAAPWTRWLPLFAMPGAMLLWVAGFSTKGPTFAGQGEMVGDDEPARGVLRITRHPANWGFLVWAGAHLPANGDVAAVVVFGAFAALALGGMLHIDARRRAAHGEAWLRFTEVSSFVPFVAILRRKNHFSLREIGGARVLGALAFYGVMLAAHEWEFGVSPFPF